MIRPNTSCVFQSISAYSGHYRPTDDCLDAFKSFLKENGVNLDEIEVHHLIFSLAHYYIYSLVIGKGRGWIRGGSLVYSSALLPLVFCW